MNQLINIKKAKEYMKSNSISYEEWLQCCSCGRCCTVDPCQYGMWNEEHTKCAMLTDNNLCGLYYYLKDMANGLFFGGGCCAPLLRDLDSLDDFHIIKEMC